jgi:hypothetical protein
MRVLFDTNIWSRLAERREAQDFHRLVRDSKLQVVVAPATLLELQRTARNANRTRQIRLICMSSWTRLRTEAAEEADELVGEIRRLRSQWLTNGSLAAFRRYELFWSKTIWERARRSLFDPKHPTMLRLDRDGESALATQRANQMTWRADGFNLDMHGISERLRSARATYDPRDEKRALADGWESNTWVDMWRVDTHGLFMHVLKAPMGKPLATYIDWLEPFVDLPEVRANVADFGRMLLYEADASGMRRSWIRWAVRFAQTAAKLESGNPRDEQLAAYLPDADLFISNDRRFCRVLEAVVASAPAPLADVRFAGITANTPNVTSALAFIVDTWRGNLPEKSPQESL